MAAGGAHLGDIWYDEFRYAVRDFLKEVLFMNDEDVILPSTISENISYVSSTLASKSAGYPYCCSKGRAIREKIDLVNQRIGYFRNDSYPEGDGPLILSGVRTYRKGKMRSIFIYPLEAILVELKYSHPIINRIIELNRTNIFRIPYGVKSSKIFYQLNNQLM
jgi:hypothetical protein